MKKYRIIDKRGKSSYYRILMPNHRGANNKGYIREHRWIFEQYHKCCLLSYVDIHHIDNNGLNNDISNLMPLIHYKHSIITNKLKRENNKKINSLKVCSLCQKGTTITTNNKFMWYRYNDNYICLKCYHRVKKNKT